MKNCQSKRKNAFTLIEVILAMAILGIICVLMTPVLLSAFRQITLSGDRHSVAKGVAADMEDIIAGETVTSTLEDVSINLPGGITVNGNKFVLTDGENAKYVDLYGYEIDSMPLVDPTTVVTTTGATTTSTTSTSAPSETVPTSTTAAKPFELRDVAVSVELWKIGYKQGRITGTTSRMEYSIIRLSDNATVTNPVWKTCSDGITYITAFATNTETYEVFVRQIENVANQKLFMVRAAPRVFYQASGSYTRFYIIDAKTGLTRRIKTSDDIKLQLRPGDIWNLVTNNYQVLTSELDVSTIYAVYSETSTAPASFPALLY